MSVISKLKKNLKYLLVQISIKSIISHPKYKVLSPFFYCYLNSIFVKAVYISIIKRFIYSFMVTFGSRLRDCRKAKNLSQNELAGILNTNHSVIGKYERDDVKPSIDVVKKLAEVLNTTVSFLLGKAESNDMFKDPDMLKRLKEINALPDEDRKCILYNLDAVLRDVKTRQAYAK